VEVTGAACQISHSSGVAPLKDQISPAVVDTLADELTRAWPPFPRDRFVAETADGLAGRELKARIARVSDALVHTLPHDAEGLAGLVERVLASPSFVGWMLWPFIDAVSRIGVDRPEETLPLLRLLTPRWTAEDAVRRYIDRYPEVAFRHLVSWAAHPDEHVRRLVSEGTRPRLPWSSRLRDLAADPSPSIALLDVLRDDESEYVRRSVANHLGDIAKDHPELAVAVATRWLAEGGTHVERVVRHGLRGPVKAGDPAALRLLGIDVDAQIEVIALTVDPAKIAIGSTATITCTLVSAAPEAVDAVIDMRISFANAAGDLTRSRVFKLVRRRLEPGAEQTIIRRQPFRPVSIRALYPGRHRIDIQVNGRILAGCDVLLLDA
jgi:3-methyladenine DNA glycosylase AlkC